MKKKINVLLLLILPAVFVFLSLLFKTSKGELYLSNYYDPSYVYLINSLNLAQLSGYGVGHIDHPGTPVQIAGAAVIFLNSGSGKNPVTDVFENPGVYLSKINLFFIFLNSAAVFILGMAAYLRLGGIYKAIFLQLTPFFSVSVFILIMTVSPEPLLVFTMLSLTTACIFYSTGKEFTKSGLLIYAVIFGIICGFGLSVKISFFPVLILPLILIKGFPNKILFCIVCAAVFFLFIIPSFSGEQPYKFFNWIRKLITHSGKYGGGEKNYFEASGILNNVKTIFINEPVFVCSYFIMLISACSVLFSKVRQNLKSNVNFKLLLAILAASTLQIIVVLKHFELHYLIPAYMLAIPGLYAVSCIIQELFPENIGRRNFVLLNLLIIIFFIVQANAFAGSLSDLNARRIESEKAYNFAEENYKNEVNISSYGASNKKYALNSGASYGGSQKNNYFALLKKMYPENYFFDKWSDNIAVLDKSSGPDKLLTSGKFIFQCDGEEAKNGFLKTYKQLSGKENVYSKKVFENSFGEMIFEIEVK